MARTPKSLKQRKTYSLSREAVAILEREIKELKAESASAVLESLLRDVARRRKLAQTAAAISQYYDELSPDDEREQTLWGKFSETQFPVD